MNDHSAAAASTPPRCSTGIPTFQREGGEGGRLIGARE